MRVPMPDGVAGRPRRPTRETASPEASPTPSGPPPPDRSAGILPSATRTWSPSDFIGDPALGHRRLPRAPSRRRRLVKVVAWYDNEWGYRQPLFDLAASAGASTRCGGPHPRGPRSPSCRQARLLRVDFNVPLDAGGTVRRRRAHPRRLPTIADLLEAGARWCSPRTWDAPRAARQPDYSLEPVAARLAELLDARGRSSPTTASATAGEAWPPTCAAASVVLLENLRFHPGEEANDDRLRRGARRPRRRLRQRRLRHRPPGPRLGGRGAARWHAQGGRPAAAAAELAGAVAAARRARAPLRRHPRRRQGRATRSTSSTPCSTASTRC